MIDRRNFFGWLAGWLGFGATAQASSAPKSTSKKRGLLVFTVNVGMMPPLKAEAFVERVKDRFRQNIAATEYDCIFTPIRGNAESKVEVYQYGNEDPNLAAVLEKIWPEIWQIKRADKWTPPSKEEISNYCMLMLGAPVVRIEMDQQQLDVCYDTVLNAMGGYLKKEGDAYLTSCALLTDQIFREGVVAHATLLLGRIRSKFKALPGPDGAFQMDGVQLVKEGKRAIRNWTSRLTDV